MRLKVKVTPGRRFGGLAELNLLWWPGFPVDFWWYRLSVICYSKVQLYW